MQEIGLNNMNKTTCVYCMDETRQVIATDGISDLCLGCWTAYKTGYERGRSEGYAQGVKDEEMMNRGNK
jgi:thioredoxin-related protein